MFSRVSNIVHFIHVFCSFGIVAQPMQQPIAETEQSQYSSGK